MGDLFEQPVPRAILVGLLAAALYLVLMAVTGGLDTAAYIGAVGVAIGGGIGSEIGRRRAARRNSGGR